jgi:hypothetical protein
MIVITTSSSISVNAAGQRMRGWRENLPDVKRSQLEVEFIATPLERVAKNRVEYNVRLSLSSLPLKLLAKMQRRYFAP